MESEPAGATYSFLGPSGTFTEAALAQVPEARGKTWRPVNNVPEALDDVVSGRSIAAMIAIENSIEGGVSVAQDALATTPGLRIVGEYLVPVSFILVARPGTQLADVRTINAHPVAYAQCHRWLNRTVPGHIHIPATSNVAAASALLDPAALGGPSDAAIAPPTIVEHHDLDVLATGIADDSNAMTRFVLVGRPARLPAPTGADKTSVIVELPEERPGTLLTMLQQFSTRGVNMSLIESRPVGDALGRYRFVIDLDGHIRDERVADALVGLRRFSPNVIYLGSYPRADRQPVQFDPRYRDEVFIGAREWLQEILGEPA
jgi:prephenate dehydratase